MFPDRGKTAPADRRVVRALVVSAAATLAAAERARSSGIGPAETRVALQQWTYQISHFIEHGRWPE